MALATIPAIAETIVKADSLMVGFSSSVENFAAHALQTLLRQATNSNPPSAWTRHGRPSFLAPAHHLSAHPAYLLITR
jgi:hypothetical protein